MVVLVVGVCVAALAFVVLGIFALDLWQRVGRLATEVSRAQERTALALGELQRLTEQMSEQRARLGSGTSGSPD